MTRLIRRCLATMIGRAAALNAAVTRRLSLSVRRCDRGSHRAQRKTQVSRDNDLSTPQKHNKLLYQPPARKQAGHTDHQKGAVCCTASPADHTEGHRHQQQAALEFRTQSTPLS